MRSGPSRCVSVSCSEQALPPAESVREITDAAKDYHAFNGLTWRKSSFSGGGGTGGGNCVEVAALPSGEILIRHSKQTDGPVLLFTCAEMSAWVRGCKAGEFDDLY